MGVRKCPKCGSVWYTALVNCAFCGVEGEEVQGPISPAKLNLGKRGVESGPAPAADAAAPAAPVATVDPSSAPSREGATEGKPPASEAKAEAPPPPLPAPEPQKIEVPPSKVDEPGPPPPPPKAERIVPPRPVLAARMEPPSAPAPRIPSAMVPLVFGALGMTAAALLPGTWFVQHNKILTTFAVLAWAILAPFAPFAWLTAQRYADRCRALGFSPASGANTGKLLGMAACFLMIFEFSGLAVFLVVQILAGRVVCPLWK